MIDHEKHSLIRPQYISWVFCSMLTLVLVGCSSSRSSKIYRAENMPSSLVIPEKQNSQTVVLSRLSRPVSVNDSIESGDVIEVNILAGIGQDDSFQFFLRIDDEGLGQLPMIGKIHLAGKSLDKAERLIAYECQKRDLYINPQVTVTMKQQRVNRITVVGAVNEPGLIELPRGASDLLSALAAAGSLSEDAGTGIEVRQAPLPNSISVGQKLPTGITLVQHSIPQGTLDLSSPNTGANGGSGQVFRVDLIKATSKENSGFMLNDGAIVMVERKMPRPIHVLGLVRSPGRYDVPIGHNLSVLDAIAMAGGTSVDVANKIYVIRKVRANQQPAVIQVSLKKAKHNPRANLNLSEGDVVSVEQTPMTVFYATIQRVGFSAGLTLPFF